ncbi:MAG: lactate dehydrogenase [Methanomicrobiales archaeon]|nr:lactate dehydrogenase [Methanomicrobiales archaeon]
MTTLAILGVGKVGGEVAFLAALQGVADEMVLYDIAEPLLKAQVLDLHHAMPELPISTDPARIREADICVFTAGTPRNPAIRTRADLLTRNMPCAKDCSNHLSRFDGVLITVGNPMDLINHYLWKLTGLPRERCIGFGGQLDSARLLLDLKSKGIPGDAWVLGEHGEHQVPLFSRLARTVEIPVREQVLEHLRDSSMEVIRGKGATIFGPAAHIVRLIRAVARDENVLLPCSCIVEGEYGLQGCSIGLPARIGKEGFRCIGQWDLDPWEDERLQEAGRFLADLILRAHV